MKQMEESEVEQGIYFSFIVTDGKKQVTYCLLHTTIRVELTAAF